MASRQQVQQPEFSSEKIEFQSIRNAYPLTEALYCYFIIPGTVKPETCDWIGIFPYGWKNIKDCRSKKMVKLESVWGCMEEKFGNVIFESEMLPKVESSTLNQLYQFVYIKNGEYIVGMSKPFSFETVETVLGQPKYESGIQHGIQQWISKMKPTFRHHYETTESKVQQSELEHYLITVQKGLEQIMSHEIEGVKLVQHGLRHIQLFIEQGIQQGIPKFVQQSIHLEITKLQSVIAELEQFYYQQVAKCVGGEQQTYRQQQGVTNNTLFETTLFRQLFAKIQHGIQSLEQRLRNITVVVPQTIQTQLEEILCQQPIQSRWTQTIQPEHVKKYWSERVKSIKHILKEQERIEQAQRELEQVRISTQLRTVERCLLKQQRKEEEIKDSLRAKLQVQIREFEKKVEGVMKYSGIELSEIKKEEYVRRYEQLLRERMTLDAEKRQVIRMKLQQTIRECEQQLKELRQFEFQYMTKFVQQLRDLFTQFEMKYQTKIYAGLFESEMIEQFKQLVNEFFYQQIKCQHELKLAHRELVVLVEEIEGKLRELEGEMLFGLAPYQYVRYQPEGCLNVELKDLINQEQLLERLSQVEQTIVDKKQYRQLPVAEEQFEQELYTPELYKQQQQQPRQYWSQQQNGKQQQFAQKWWKQIQTPIEEELCSFGMPTISTGLPTTTITTGLPTGLPTTTTTIGGKHIEQLEKLRRQFEELQSIKSQIDMKLMLADKKVGQFERQFESKFLPRQFEETVECVEQPKSLSFVVESMRPEVYGVEEMLGQLEGELVKLRLTSELKQHQHQGQQYRQQVQQPTARIAVFGAQPRVCLEGELVNGLFGQQMTEQQPEQCLLTKVVKQQETKRETTVLSNGTEQPKSFEYRFPVGGKIAHYEF